MIPSGRYVADADGRVHGSAPDEEVHAAVDDLMRPIGAHLYGRRRPLTLRGCRAFGNGVVHLTYAGPTG